MTPACHNLITFGNDGHHCLTNVGDAEIIGNVERGLLCILGTFCYSVVVAVAELKVLNPTRTEKTVHLIAMNDGRRHDQRCHTVAMHLNLRPADSMI